MPNKTKLLFLVASCCCSIISLNCTCLLECVPVVRLVVIIYFLHEEGYFVMRGLNCIFYLFEERAEAYFIIFLHSITCVKTTLSQEQISEMLEIDVENLFTFSSPSCLLTQSSKT